MISDSLSAPAQPVCVAGSDDQKDYISKCSSKWAAMQTQLQDDLCLALRTSAACVRRRKVTYLTLCSSKRAAMETQLRDDVCLALRVPKGSVSVLCYCRGGGFVAEVRLCGVMPSATGDMTVVKNARDLADELVRQVCPDQKCT